MAEPVGWNFNTFLVDREGNVVKRFDSQVKPDDEGLRAAIDALFQARQPMVLDINAKTRFR